MKTLTELLNRLSKAEIADLNNGVDRVYKVTPPDGVSHFVLSNSKGNAAQEVCEVEVCTQKQLQTALLNNLLEQQKNADSPKAKS